jgi:HD superfamily phosphohydrolase YqeK
MNFYAHTADDGRQWQPLVTHLRNVAGLSEKFAAPFGMAAEARLAGLQHDFQKQNN